MHVDGSDFYNDFQVPLLKLKHQNFSKGAMGGNKLKRIIK